MIAAGRSAISLRAALSGARLVLAGGIGAYAVPASVLLAVVMGQRSSFGLFLAPINTSTGIGLASISLAAAASQLAWGFAQPFCGMMASRYGPARVIAAGALLFSLANVATVFATGSASLLLVLSLAGAVGAAAGGAPLLLGVVGQRVAPSRRGLANGIVSAGGSAGQLVFAPLAQMTIAGAGWVSAMLLMALLTLAATPLARAFRDRRRVPGGLMIANEAAGTPAGGSRPGSAEPGGTHPGGVRSALRGRPFWVVTGGFSVCGFHVGFLTAHMPGVIEACGLQAALAGAWLAIVGACNIAGSVVSGVLSQRRSMSAMLSVVYTARGLGVLAFMLAPKTPTVVLLFGAWMGATYMATVPPTAGLLARFYGPGSLATLFGLAMMFHQIGSFLGVWLGGLAFQSSGHFDLLWTIDIVLALLAALVHLPLLRHERGAVPGAPPMAVQPVLAVRAAGRPAG